MNAVHDTMSTSPVAVGPTTSISRLLTLFDRYDFNAFPVVGQRNRLLGIVSKLDLLELFLGRSRSTLGATDVSLHHPGRGRHASKGCLRRTA